MYNILLYFGASLSLPFLARSDLRLFAFFMCVPVHIQFADTEWNKWRTTLFDARRCEDENTHTNILAEWWNVRVT